MFEFAATGEAVQLMFRAIAPEGGMIGALGEQFTRRCMRLLEGVHGCKQGDEARQYLHHISPLLWSFPGKKGD